MYLRIRKIWNPYYKEIRFKVQWFDWDEDYEEVCGRDRGRFSRHGDGTQVRIRLSRLRGIRISLVKRSNCSAETKINDSSKCSLEDSDNWFRIISLMKRLLMTLLASWDKMLIVCVSILISLTLKSFHKYFLEMHEDGWFFFWILAYFLLNKITISYLLTCQ